MFFWLPIDLTVNMDDKTIPIYEPKTISVIPRTYLNCSKFENPMLNDFKRMDAINDKTNREGMNVAINTYSLLNFGSLVAAENLAAAKYLTMAVVYTLNMGNIKATDVVISSNKKAPITYNPTIKTTTKK